jgi:hypothetical protein
MMVKLSEAVAIAMAQVPLPRDPAIPPDARSSTSRRGARASVATNNGTCAHFSDRVAKDIALRP